MTRSGLVGRILVAVLILSCPTMAFAQAVANAEIHGSVADPSGAAIVGAQIKATQTDTGQLRTTVSSTDGSYVLSNLPIGPYRLEVSSPSFNNYVQSGIVLQVGNNVQINVSLQVGNVTEQVLVHANAEMVETQDTAISQVVDQGRIIDLPLNGRQVTDLIALSGGTSVPPATVQSRVLTTHDYPTSVAISVAGGQVNGNNYLLDGGDHNDNHSNVNLPFPMPDALQEFSVQTNGVSARYGLHPGSVVNVVTKSGTNQIHGDLFEFVRNGDFDARDFFAATQDTLRRNQFGGTVGGPIRKDKLFLFNGFQATHVRTAPPNTISYVPTQAMINGDFSTYESAGCQSNGKAVQLTDPANGNKPFANNQIPVSRFSPPIVNLMKDIPVAGNVCGQLVYAAPNPNDENQYVGKVDWVVSPKNTLTGRYLILDYTNPAYYTNNILTTTRSGFDERVQSVLLGDTYAITPTLVNSIHATYNRFSVNRTPPAGMPSPVSLGANMFNLAPGFLDMTVTSEFAIGGGSNAPAYFDRNQYQVADDIDLMRGRHHFMFGGEFIDMQFNQANLYYGNGEWTFNGSLTTGALADFMLGLPSNLLAGNKDFETMRERYYALYAQDDIQVKKGLTVHFGVRWEPFTPEHDPFGRGVEFSLARFVAGQKSTFYPSAPAGLLFHGDPGIPIADTTGSNKDFAPRVGLAWDPTGSGKMSIRTSYGVFFDEPEIYTNSTFGLQSPWGNTVNLTAPAGGFANPFQGYPGGDPFPSPPPSGSSATFVQEGAYYITAPVGHHPYMQQWDMALQRQFGRDWIASATYIGNKSTHLRSTYEADPATYIPGASTTANTNQRRLLYLLNPTQGAYISTITAMDDGVNSTYEGVILTLQHRFAHNFSWLSNYTYSHCLQDSEVLGNKIQGNMRQQSFNRNADYSSCDFDLPQAFSTSLLASSPKFANRALEAVAGNWQLSILVTAHPGFPLAPTTGVDNSLTGIGLDRPNVVGNPYERNLKTLLWLNPAGFAANPLGTFGNAGFNSLVGPGFFDLDSSIIRHFRVREHQAVELRFEFFNTLNNVNFLNPVANLHTATFGEILSDISPRILQFAAKYSF